LDTSFTVSRFLHTVSRGQGDQFAVLDVNGNRDQPLYFRAQYVNSCGTTSGWSPTQHQAPRYAPVLLVHGLWSDRGTWSPLWINHLEAAEGYGPARFDNPSLNACAGSWVDWGNDLVQLIEDRLDVMWPHDEVVDIIAHSQGGLAARWAIEQRRISPQVRSLVMLATPNHGGRFSTFGAALIRTFWGTWWPCNHAARVEALAAYAPAMRALNFINPTMVDGICTDGPLETSVQSRRGSTEYFTLAGTGPSIRECVPPLNLLLRCRIASGRGEADVGTCSGDGVVPWKSVRLRALPDQNWRDVDVGSITPGLTHTTALSYPPVSVGILNSDEVVGFAFDRLRRVPGVPPLREELTLSAVPADSFSLVVSMIDSVAPGSTRPTSVLVDTTTSVTVMCSWWDVPVSVTLMAPDGTTYAPSDTATHSWLRYEEDEDLGYAAFAVELPAPGSWTLIAGGNPGPGHAQYRLDWVAGGSPYVLDAWLSSNVVTPGEGLVLAARIMASGEVLSGSHVVLAGIIHER
jgi:pimeloyl-ACP methyl ester carboxylesterase